MNNFKTTRWNLIKIHTNGRAQWEKMQCTRTITLFYLITELLHFVPQHNSSTFIKIIYWLLCKLVHCTTIKKALFSNFKKDNPKMIKTRITKSITFLFLGRVSKYFTTISYQGGVLGVFIKFNDSSSLIVHFMSPALP